MSLGVQPVGRDPATRAIRKSCWQIVGVKESYRSYTMIKFFKDESGATAIEYGLIAAAMGLALVTVMPTLASAITGSFSSLAGHISSGT